MDKKRLACLGKCSLWHDSSIDECKKIGCEHIVEVPIDDCCKDYATLSAAARRLVKAARLEDWPPTDLLTKSAQVNERKAALAEVEALLKDEK